MVNSVLAVSEADKIKREARRKEEQKEKRSDSLFSRILEEKTEEQVQSQESPQVCQTTTYGQDSRLHTFQYQKREYHY